MNFRRIRERSDLLECCQTQLRRINYSFPHFASPFLNFVIIETIPKHQNSCTKTRVWSRSEYVPLECYDIVVVAKWMNEYLLNLLHVKLHCSLVRWHLLLLCTAVYPKACVKACVLG